MGLKKEELEAEEVKEILFGEDYDYDAADKFLGVASPLPERDDADYISTKTARGNT